jgi:hypothetical protein
LGIRICRRWRSGPEGPYPIDLPLLLPGVGNGTARRARMMLRVAALGFMGASQRDPLHSKSRRLFSVYWTKLSYGQTLRKSAR